jgi:predicted ATPase
MARMRIRNFGPIGNGLDTDDGYMDFNRVTLFVGNQATGKSTAAKLYSTFSRLEKSLDSGAYPG